MDRRFDLSRVRLQMPSIDGVAVHDELVATAPDLVDRFVVMSGGAVTPRAASFLAHKRPRSLGKPIALPELLAMVCTIRA